MTQPSPSLDELALDEMALPGEGRAALGRAVEQMGPTGLQRRRRMIRRLAEDDGVTFGGSTPEHAPQPWRVDPLPVLLEADEWARLERGLHQRARILDALLVDLYGPRRTLHQRILPAEVVLGQSGFLPGADKIWLPTRHQLLLAATDLVRGPDGAWQVLSDRVQAPSGAGYAMANRRLVARTLESLHRATGLRRLRPFFDVMAATLEQAAPAGSDLPRVVLLSPGPGSETAFDQAQLATLLGHSLAQSDDLVLLDGRLWLRTTARLQPVDVLLRRVDADWCDSLDLRSESRLGVPGLVAAARRGTLSVVNPLGAGVLENPGLAPYWGALAHFLLGEEPELTMPETWWCGQASHLDHVLTHLDELVVKPISRSVEARSVPGWTLSVAQKDELLRRIEAEPWAWTAQLPVRPSTAPLVTTQGLEQRPLTLRTFGVALGSDYHFMPGGLARVADDPADLVISNHRGAWAKDVWVLEDESVPVRVPAELGQPRVRAVRHEQVPVGLTPRGAQNLYWMGRYAERTEQTARLVLVGDDLLEDHLEHPRTQGHRAMRRVLDAIQASTGVVDDLSELLVSPSLPASTAWTLERTQLAAAEVRELLSLDTPAILSGLQRAIADARAEGVEAQPLAHRLLEGCLALSGLSAESLVRDQVWAFTEAGRRVERAQATVRLLREALGRTTSAGVDTMVVEAVLRACESLITHRRNRAAGVGAEDASVAALELLLTDLTNPRSVVFQLDRLADALALVPVAQLTAQLHELVTQVREADLAEACQHDRADLVDLLTDLENRLRTFSDTLTAVHFTMQAPQHAHAVAELQQGAR